MGEWAVRALRGVIAVGLLGSLAVQLVLVPLMWIDMDEAGTGVRVSSAVVAVLVVVALQVVAVCIWRLLTMVSEGRVFSNASFRYVDVVIGAIAAASVLVFAVAVIARFANLSTPGDEVAPGAIGLICGVALMVGGVALIVYVLRVLLAQAVALDSATRSLQAELDVVI